MIVRAIQIAEAGEWARLRGRLWPDADPQELTAETQAFLEGAEMPTIAAAFVAREEEGDEAIGFLELGVRPFADGCESRPVAHVEGWYVEPAARGRGVGRALMTAAENWARERGFTELASDTEVENDLSLAAHLRFGFFETERLIKFRKPLG
ncbi:MAG: GNAT family N-acetyltransferase [Candidatus Cybelea sp.]|jgi:aminoglycoside 6'-N-acetyltransferase I